MIMADNTSNMDTLVDGIESRAQALGIYFNGQWTRLHCMPHTVHLSAIEVSTKIPELSPM